MNKKLKIDKERLWVYSPTPNVVVKTTVNSIITEEKLQVAINKAVDANEILSCCVVFDSNQETYYQIQADTIYPINEYFDEWEKVVLAQAKEPFRPDKGNLIRFFYSYKEGNTELLLIAHHLMGDGTSYAYLIQDIMRILNGQMLVNKPMQLFQMEDLPKKSKLPFLMRIVLKVVNNKFDETGKTFTSEDYYNMAKRYHKDKDIYIITKTFTKEEYLHIKDMAKECDVTLNTMIVTALLQATKVKSEIGQAVSIRKPGNEGMGNFVTGVSVISEYNLCKSFKDNAKIVQNEIYKKLHNEKKKYLLLQFMGGIKGSLLDAIYFARYDGYENKTVKQLSSMFGRMWNTNGISVTNLTKLPIANTFGDFKLLDFIFVPPLVSNLNKIMGIATIGDTMTISMSIREDENKQNNLRFFETAMETLIR